MAKRKSTVEELLDLISAICFHLPVWAIALLPFLCGGGCYLAVDYLIQNKLQVMFAGEIAQTLTNALSLFVFVITALAALKGFIGRKQRKALLAQTQSLDELRNLSWSDFEKLISEVYRSEGFKVEEMGGNGPDGGIDLVATTPNGGRELIQCKHWKTLKVGVKIVREMLGVLAKEGGSKAVVICTGEYTKDALAFAQGQPIELINGPILLERIHAFNATAASTDDAPAITPEPEASNLPIQSEAALCPQCGSALIERIAKRGTNAGNCFLGCTAFPKCRYTQQ